MKHNSLRLIISALFFGTIMSLSAQLDTTVWNSTKKVEDNRFIVEIPNDWKVVTLPQASEFSHKFEFTGIGIKPIVMETPVPAFLTIKKSGQIEVSTILEGELEDFNNFSDKVQEPNYKYDTIQLKMKSGETGLMLHTRYYRRSKASNYSRYYFVAQNPKSNDYYILAFTFQYKDPTYDIERSNKFKEYVQRTVNRYSFR